MSLLDRLLRWPRLSDELQPRHSFASQIGQRVDSVINGFTGLGSGGDKGSVARPNTYVMQLTDEELRSLHANNGLARRIVEILPSRACRRGWLVPEMAEEERRLRIWAKVSEALTWARLYGGSALLMVTEDFVPRSLRADPMRYLSTPLDMSRIGSLKAVQVFDSFEAYPTEYNKDITSPYYRSPSMWSISADGLTAFVHGSRIIHFRGARRPPSEQRGGGWYRAGRMPDDSCLQSVWDELRRLTETMQGGAVLAQELRESVLKIGELPSISTGDQAAKLDMRIRTMQRTKSMLNMIMIGPNDSYETKSNPVGGFDQLSKEAKSMLSAVTGIPEVILFGDTPSGLNSDGKSSWEGFYQLISDYEESNREPLEQLYQVIYAAKDGPTGGRIPEEWSLDFHPLNEPSEGEIASLRKLVAETDAIYLDRSVYSPAEVAESRFGRDGWVMNMMEVEPLDPAEEDRIAEEVASGVAAEIASASISLDAQDPISESNRELASK